MDTRVVVIGAGIAGLSCARELTHHGIPNVVLERARGVGGRCATRRIEGQPVDHGVALLHAESTEFGNLLNELDPAGKVPGWPVRVWGPKMACQPNAYRPGRRRMARREGVSVFPKHLARGCDVRLGVEVSAVRAVGGALEVSAASGESWRARFVVAACAVDESLRLVEPCVRGWEGAGEGLARLAAIPVQPALTVIAGYPLDAPEPEFDVWHPLEATMLHTISHDSSKRDAPRFRVLVLQGRPHWSRERMAGPVETWRDELLWEAAELMGRWVERPAFVQTHVWHAARVLRQDQLERGLTFVAPFGGGVGVIGDAFACTPGIEGAYYSGLAMGEEIRRSPMLHPA